MGEARAKRMAGPSIEATATTPPPSRDEVVRALVTAASVAIVLAIVVVLPAERGVDPTGLGRVLGLTAMGEAKRAMDADAHAPTTPEVITTLVAPAPSASSSALAPSVSASSTNPGVRADVTKVKLRPNQSIEVKLAMSEGNRVTFAWSLDRGRVSYDLHADRVAGSYHSYKKEKVATSDKGELVAAFDGYHGWFWRNRSPDELTITLETSGAYREVKEMK